MQVELEARGVQVELEPKIKVRYKEIIVGDYAADLLVEAKIIVELKTDPVYQSIHEAQLLNELRGTGMRLGYLINFGRDGWNTSAWSFDLYLCQSVSICG